MSRGTCNVRQIVRKKANGKKLKETDTDKFPSEKKLSRNFFFEFLAESDNFVAIYHRHLSENSDK